MVEIEDEFVNDVGGVDVEFGNVDKVKLDVDDCVVKGNEEDDCVVKGINVEGNDVEMDESVGNVICSKGDQISVEESVNNGGTTCRGNKGGGSDSFISILSLFD